MKRIWVVLIAVICSAAMLAAQTKSDKQTTTGKTTAGTSAAATTKSGADKGAATAGAKIDINSASKDELEKLPGIGTVTSQKIIDGRPYKTKRDLLTKKIVGQKEYDKIKDQIIAHQDTAGAAKKSKAK